MALPVHFIGVSLFWAAVLLHSTLSITITWLYTVPLGLFCTVNSKGHDVFTDEPPGTCRPPYSWSEWVVHIRGGWFPTISLRFPCRWGCMKMTHHARHLSLDSYNMKMITICHRAVKMMHRPPSTLKWSSIIAASYKLGTEIIWLVLGKECSTTPVALPSLNKYGMLLLLFSVCMEEQLNVSKKKNHKNAQTFFPPMKIARLHSICLQIIVQQCRMLLSLKY